jgi:hypothetical protein
MDNRIADAAFAPLATTLSNFVHHCFNISISIDELEFYRLSRYFWCMKAQLCPRGA